MRATPTEHTHYTHGYAPSVLASHRARTARNSAGYLLPMLRGGMSLLDVGSGAGTITADLAALVAPGHVTALEVTDEAVAVTRAGLAAAGAGTVEVRRGDVADLPFDDDSFDAVHAHQVLQHVGDPVVALREMMRVARPGGVVAVRDSDYAGFTWWPESAGLTRWLELYRAAARANGGEPDAGRRLLAWAHGAGATEVTASSSTWCYADDAARQLWGGTWAQRILDSSIAEQLTSSGMATRDELEQISQAWRHWAADPDGWFSLLHGEILIHV